MNRFGWMTALALMGCVAGTGEAGAAELSVTYKGVIEAASANTGPSEIQPITLSSNSFTETFTQKDGFVLARLEVAPFTVHSDFFNSDYFGPYIFNIDDSYVIKNLGIGYSFISFLPNGLIYSTIQSGPSQTALGYNVLDGTSEQFETNVFVGGAFHADFGSDLTFQLLATSVEISAVPLPASLPLLAVGLIALSPLTWLRRLKGAR